MESISDEKKNFIIIQLVLTGISPCAVRKIFDREFHPACLKSTLRKESNKIKRFVNKAQWKILYPGVGEFFLWKVT